MVPHRWGHVVRLRDLPQVHGGNLLWLTASDVDPVELGAELRALGLVKLRIEDDALGARVRASPALAGLRFDHLVVMALQAPRASAPQVPVREATPAEATHAWRTDWGESDAPPEVAAQLVAYRERLMAAGGRVFVAGDADGHASLFEAPGSAQVEDVFTREAQRGRGIGLAIVCAAVDAARAADPERFVFLIAEQHATGLYERAGFRAVGWCWEATREDT